MSTKGLLFARRAIGGSLHRWAFHGSAAPLLLDLKRMGGMEPLGVMVDRYGSVPFSGEAWGSELMRQHIVLVDFPILSHALEHARGSAVWRPRAARAESSDSAPPSSVEELRRARYATLDERDRALVDDPYPVIVAADPRGAERVYGATPERIVRGPIPIDGLRLFVPALHLDDARARCPGASVEPLELLDELRGFWERAFETWRDHLPPEAARELAARVARDQRLGREDPSHLEHLFWEDSQARASMLAELDRELAARSHHERLLPLVRAAITHSAWGRAKELIGEAIGVATELEDEPSLRYLKAILREHEWKEHRRISPSRPTVPRTIDVVTERFDELASALFHLRVGGELLLGRLRLSEHWERGWTERMHDASVQSDSLLGPVVDLRISTGGVTAFYRPITDAERRDAFAAAAVDPHSELIFPYPSLLGANGAELESDALGWTGSPELELALDQGEAPQRRWLVRWLAGQDLRGARVFDPACSTGTFLAAVREAQPGCITIGQDLSESMIARARSRLDEAHVGDSIRPAVLDGSVDLLLLRFLNASVVTTAQAHRLFERLLKTVRVGGRIVLLGFTPVLLSGAAFERLGLSIVRRLAHDEETASLHQCYVLEKLDPEIGSIADLLP
ncbi:MAG: methyltransferase domain-containing protein [Deltaproteobacteria bacterium]|nr:methyltransferase domain-containing protein [Deltaproteobacteria bacterium]